eukprot:tig00001376_g8528.t1
MQSQSQAFSVALYLPRTAPAAQPATVKRRVLSPANLRSQFTSRPRGAHQRLARVRAFEGQAPVHWVAAETGKDEGSSGIDWDSEFKRILDERGDALKVEEGGKTPAPVSPGPPEVPEDEFYSSLSAIKGQYKGKGKEFLKPLDEEETKEGGEASGPPLPSSRELKAKGYDFWQDWQKYRQLHDLPDATNSEGEAPVLYAAEASKGPLDALLKRLYKALYRAYMRLQAKFDALTAPKPAQDEAARAAAVNAAAGEIDFNSAWRKYKTDKSPSAEGLRAVGDDEDGTPLVRKRTEAEERDMATRVVGSIFAIAVVAGLIAVALFKSGAIHGGSPRPFS